MCLIIAPGADGKKALLPRDVFDYVYSKNDDGFGAMWCEDGQVKHFKGLSPSKDEEYAAMERLTEEHPDIIFHMRYRTHGATIPGLSHPFRLLHRSRHGHDMFFMHNGVLGKYGNNLQYGQSDTTVFKDKVLLPLLTRDADALDDPEVWATIETLTSGSRMVFMRSDGKVWMTHKPSWNNRYGLTLSNTYMLPSESYGSSYSGNRGTTGNSNVVTIGSSQPTGSSGSKDIKVYTLYRQIEIVGPGNNKKWVGHWCRQVIEGIIQTEAGTYYYDKGPHLPINFEEHFIKKEDVQDAIYRRAKEIEADAKKKGEDVEARLRDNFQRAYPERTTPIPSESELNDDLPWTDEDGDSTLSTGVRSKSTMGTMEEKLRYARLVHNCHGGVVALREQLVADVLCMGNDEMYSFVKEDPETATTVMAEIFDILMEQNTWLRLADDDCADYGFDEEVLTAVGDTTGAQHTAAMKEITGERRRMYELALQARQAQEENKKTEEEKKVA